MLGVLPFVEDPDLSVSAARALAQHLPPCALIKSLLPPNFHMTEVMDLNNPHQVASCFITLSNLIFLLHFLLLLKFVSSQMHIYSCH